MRNKTIDHLQGVRMQIDDANYSAHLGLSYLGLRCVLMSRTSLSWTCLVSWLWILNSVLLFCFGSVHKYGDVYTNTNTFHDDDWELIVQGFHRAYATGAACQQRTLTPPDTWSCPTFGLSCVLMSRSICPELVLSPDFWISNILRYFSFAFKHVIWARMCNQMLPGTEFETRVNIHFVRLGSPHRNLNCRDWLSPASKSRYGWTITKAT